MKVIGVILVCMAAALFCISCAALVAGAHYPARVKAKVYAITDPVVDAISDDALRHQKEKEYEQIVSAATAVAGELDANLTSLGTGVAAVAVIQSICGIYLLIRNDKKSA